MNIGGIWDDRKSGESGEFAFCADGLSLKWGLHARCYEDKRYFFLLEGQFFDREASQAFADPKALEEAYGVYAYIRYDKTTHKLDIGGDRLGFFPIYFAAEGNRFVFSTSINFVKAALVHKTVDYEAWQELMGLGEILGEKTPVKQIKRLREGTRIELDRGKPNFNRFWSPELPDTVDDTTYIAQNNALLDQALALTANQERPKIVLLSGGEDSRRIALATTRQGLTVTFATQEAAHRGSMDNDTKLAREVAIRLGGKISVEASADEQQFVRDWKMRDRCLGFESVAHEWLLPLIRGIPPRALVYDGIVGDVTVNGHYFKQFPQAVECYRDVDALARMICGNADRTPWTAELRRLAGSSLVERTAHILRQYPDSPHRLTLYFLLNHTRRKIALAAQFFAMFGHWMCYPFLYYPLFVQSLSAGPRQQIARFHQRECMKVIAPEIAAIPTTRGVVASQYLTDFGLLEERKLRHLRKTLRISNEALEVFPTLSFRYHVMDLLRDPRGEIVKRFGWFVEPVSRFSDFLHWLETDTVGRVLPPLDLMKDQP